MRRLKLNDFLNMHGFKPAPSIRRSCQDVRWHSMAHRGQEASFSISPFLLQLQTVHWVKVGKAGVSVPLQWNVALKNCCSHYAVDSSVSQHFRKGLKQLRKSSRGSPGSKTHAASLGPHRSPGSLLLQTSKQEVKCTFTVLVFSVFVVMR